jgi:hypothetical protein
VAGDTTPPKLVCEVHPNCKKPVVAKIGLPSPHAKWACQKGFNEWRESHDGNKNE